MERFVAYHGWCTVLRKSNMQRKDLCLLSFINLLQIYYMHIKLESELLLQVKAEGIVNLMLVYNYAKNILDQINIWTIILYLWFHYTTAMHWVFRRWTSELLFVWCWWWGGNSWCWFCSVCISLGNLLLQSQFQYNCLCSSLRTGTNTGSVTMFTKMVEYV